MQVLNLAAIPITFPGIGWLAKTDAGQKPDRDLLPSHLESLARDAVFRGLRVTFGRTDPEGKQPDASKD